MSDVKNGPIWYLISEQINDATQSRYAEIMTWERYYTDESEANQMVARMNEVAADYKQEDIDAGEEETTTVLHRVVKAIRSPRDDMGAVAGEGGKIAVYGVMEDIQSIAGSEYFLSALAAEEAVQDLRALNDKEYVIQWMFSDPDMAKNSG